MTAIYAVVYTFLTASNAHALEVAALITKETEQSVKVLDFLRSHDLVVRKINVSNDNELLPLEARIGNADSLLIIGKEAFEYYLDKQLDIPSLVLFVKSSTFYHLTLAASHISLVENRPDYTDKISAIYSDPSPKEQMALVKRHYPYPAIATLLSPLNYYLEDELRQSAKELQLTLDIIKVDKDIDINRALNTLPPKHALVALPDHYIYNSMTLKNIVISTYRSGRPIFGFSRTMVKAGAVASVITDLETLSKECLEVLKRPNEAQAIRQYAQQSSIVINGAVARSLNLISLQQEDHQTL